MSKRPKTINNQNYIDIHSHILPGIDDGARNEKESLRMFQIAAEAGIGTVIATPHFHYKKGRVSPQDIYNTILKMQELLEENKIPIKICPGNELYYSHGLLDAVKAGEALTMAGSEYVLLEFSPGSEKRKIQNAIYQFLCEGYNPIIAHAERYQAFQYQFDFIEEIEKMGAYYQINGSSLNGAAGWKIRKFSRNLMKKDFITFIATDAHDVDKRAPHFGKMTDWIVKKEGESQLKVYLKENPEKIIKNEII